MGKTTTKFSPEVRERAMRLVFDNKGQHGLRGQAIVSSGPIRPGRRNVPHGTKRRTPRVFGYSERTGRISAVNKRVVASFEGVSK